MTSVPYSLLAATVDRFFASIGISTAPWYLAAACSALFVPKEYIHAVFLGEDFRICRIQRFLVRLCGNCSAMLGPQWYMQCVSHGVRVFPRFLRGKSTSDPEVDSRRNCGLSAVAAHLQVVDSLLWHRDWLIHMVHTVQITIEIPLLPRGQGGRCPL